MSRENSYLTLIIAPWGNPFQWDEVEYVFNDIRTQSSTSLTAIMEKYAIDENTNILIIVPETITCISGRSLVKYRMYCGLLLPEILTYYKDNDYKKVLTSLYSTVRRYIAENICNKLEEKNIIESSKCLKMINVVITPNIGEYRCCYECDKYIIKWSISEKITDVDIMSYYGSIILLEATKTFIETLMKVRDTVNMIRIVLDITHGINYMPLMTYRATMFLARLFSSLTHLRTIVTLYNSEPYSPGVKTLRIHKVEEEVINPNKAVQRLVYTYAMKYSNLKTESNLKSLETTIGNVKKVLNEINFGVYVREHKKFLNGIASSIHYSLPLALLYSEHLDRYHDQTVKLNDLLTYYLEYSEKLLGEKHNNYEAWKPGYLPLVDTQDNNDNEINIIHQVVLDYDYTKAILSILGLKGYASKIYDEYSNKLSIEGNEILYVDIESLKSLLDKYLNGPHYLTSSNEVGLILKAQEEADQYTRNPLVKMVIQSKSSSKEECGNLCNIRERDRKPSMRNFVAHAGLSSDIVCVKWSNDELMLRYCESEKLLDTLRDALNKIKEFLS